MKIYFDGVLQYEDNHWFQVAKLVVPSNIKVLGIECQNMGGPKGVLASATDGMVTDRNWECSSNENLKIIDGTQGSWSKPDFIDSMGDFSSSISFGSNNGSNKR